VTSFGGTNADDRVTVAILFLLLVITLGQTAGFGVSVLVHRPARVRTLPPWDRTLGATLGVTGTLLLVWLLMPSMSAAQGWPARVARGSALVRLADHAPDPPDRFEAIGRSIRDAPYPAVINASPAADPGPLLGPSPLTPRERNTVALSVVRVHTEACGYEMFGTGWIYADETVVTAAHVVARASKMTVDSGNETRRAFVVSFDSARDVAVLHVPDLHGLRLELAPAHAGEAAAVFGYPGGGTLRATDALIGEREDAAVSDVLDGQQHQSRQVLPVHADVRAGDSGGPLVDGSGQVVGLVFALDGKTRDLAWVTAIDELGDATQHALTHPDDRPDTGACPD
jgi:S1-C subfamily serine protease